MTKNVDSEISYGRTAARALKLRERSLAGDDLAETELIDVLDGLSEAEYAKYCAVAYADQEWKNLAE